MYVVTLVTQKGGSGKSTLTVGLAVAAMEDANRVAVIEADSQGTVSSWRRRRTNPYPRVDRVADRVEIERAIPRLRAEGGRARDYRHCSHEQQLEQLRHFGG
jgi:chromosome partitioning protein